MNKRMSLYLKDVESMEKIMREENRELTSEIFESAFWEIKLGRDEDFRGILKNLYSGNFTMRRTLSSILEVVAYNEARRTPNKVRLAEIIKQAVSGKKWREDWAMECGDYNPKRREPWLRVIYEVYERLVRDMENCENLIKSSELFEDKKPWEISANDGITEERYFKKAEFKVRAEILKRQVEDSEISAEEVVTLIIENFDVLHEYQSTYEALEYCIMCVQEVNDKEIIRKNLREFCCEVERK